jgi:hypothetical protein
MYMKDDLSVWRRTLKERREKPVRPPLAPIGGSPTSVSAYCHQLSFSFLSEIIEFRVRGGNQLLVKVISRDIVYPIFVRGCFPTL